MTVNQLTVSDILKFRGTWRNYQARVLQHAAEYMRDGRVHIVAAPGSGKTTLGIELMARLGKPALVLAPSVTIREQWVERIEEAFLKDGCNSTEYLSQDLKAPKLITVATYQALHSAMTHYSGSLAGEGEGEEPSGKKSNVRESEGRDETVDFHDFDVTAAMKEAGVGVLCLDECHHLRSEWWKALEDFKSQFEGIKVIALTATPPYDSTPAMWNRYMEMCGEIDEEITIPELVKEGSLCPHQDYVYFNYPTEEEAAEVQRFRQRSGEMFRKLMEDAVFLEAVRTHQSLTTGELSRGLSESPEYLTALCAYLKVHNVTMPAAVRRYAAGGRKMDAECMEQLLQGFIYGDAEAYTGQEGYREQLEASLKAAGLIEKRKVTLRANAAIEKLLISSKGKCSSIRAVVGHEYGQLGKNLRMLILTDYIRREYEQNIGGTEDVTALGVLPFFEQLRRETCRPDMERLRLGVLCGTMVIIPAEAREALLAAVGESGSVTFSSVGHLPEADYLKVTAVGDAHFLTGAVTNIFTQGYMQVLVGTKSLLGEGWDSPCINALILASFVGAFMLSNQMRGRAIRVFREQPDKTSNIWHLVCLRPECASDGEDEISEDFSLLERRMEHFLGLHYTQDVIESGLSRLSVIGPPYRKEHVAEMNRQMLALSGERRSLRERWNRAMMRADTMEVAEETEVDSGCISNQMHRKIKRTAAVSGVAAAALGVAAVSGVLGGFSVIAAIGAIASGIICLARGVASSRMKTPEKRLLICGKAIRTALLQQRLLESSKNSVESVCEQDGRCSVYLAGGGGRDRALFARCVREFYGDVKDQRYLLVKKGSNRGADGIYCVPECCARKKEDAQRFADCLRSYIRDYELVYTRNEEGKEILLEGRMRAAGSGNNRCSTRRRLGGKS